MYIAHALDRTSSAWLFLALFALGSASNLLSLPRAWARDLGRGKANRVNFALSRRTRRTQPRERLQEHPQPAQHRLPHEGQPGPAGTGAARPLGGHGPLRPDPRRPHRLRAVHPPRWPPLRQRRHPHRSRRQQGDQGHDHQVPHPGRPGRPLCAGLGLPRPAHRAPGGKEGGQARRQDQRRRLPPGLPRLCRPPGGRPAPRLQAPGGAGGLGESLPDHGLRLRGQHHSRPWGDLGQWPCPQGLQAGALVHRLRFGPGGGRGGVRRQGVHLYRRALPGPGRGVPLHPLPLGAQRPRRGAPVGGHLDHHPLDPARQSGGGLQPRAGIRPHPDRRRSWA